MNDKKLIKLLDNINKSLEIDKDTRKDKNVGIIRSYKDNILEIEGDANYFMGEVLSIQGTEYKALVMNLEKGFTSAVMLNPSYEIKEGMFVESNDTGLDIGVSNSILSRVVDSLGNPIDGEEDYKKDTKMMLERIADGVMARKKVDTPLETGILSIDSLIPIGRGQRELIIGDRQTGKTTIALDTIINQKGKDVICIYAAIGQRESRIASIYETLKSYKALDYSIIVAAGASSPAAMQFLAPYSATAIAEYYLKQGKDVLVVYDDLSKHAVAYREMSLLLRRPPGREAYPGDVFYIHSRLLERSVKLNDKYGGGSITSLPIIETQAGDVSAYIPTNVISITDGQIFLDTELFNKGILPPINIGISVSRVGSSAQTKIMKKSAGTLKLDLASYYELESFSQFASDLDEKTKQTLLRGRRIVLSMIQKQNNPYQLWEEIIIIHTVIKGYLDKFNEERISDKLKGLLQHIEANNAEFIDELNNKKDLTEDIEKQIDSMLTNYFKD